MGKRGAKRRQIKLFSSVPPQKTSQGGDQIKNADDYKQAKQVEGNNTNKSSPIELVELSGSHAVGYHQESTIITFTPTAPATAPASHQAPLEKNPPPTPPLPSPASLVGDPGSSTGDEPGGSPPLPAVLVDENKQKEANVWSAVIGACGFFATIFCFFACAAFAYFTSSVLTKETQKMCATIIALAFLGIAACMIVCLFAIKSIMYLSGLKSRFLSWTMVLAAILVITNCVISCFIIFTFYNQRITQESVEGRKT